MHHDAEKLKQIREFGTDLQKKYIDACIEHGNQRDAAAALKVAKSSIAGAVRAAELKAATREPDKPIKILVLPDVQAKSGINFDYLARIGQYAVDKKPDVIVCIGDFADMPSLSNYDVGKKSFEGRRYLRDIEAGKEAMRAFLLPIELYNDGHVKKYNPRKVMCLGNHEFRISRATEGDPKLDGVLSVDHLEYADFGWQVVPFLEVINIAGIAFSHYFQTGVMGRPASSAAAQLRVTNMSCFAGHQQGKQIAYAKRADGKILTSIICGSAYEHDEDYLGVQGNAHWRGFFMLHEVKDGAFDEMPVSLNYINQKYPNVTAYKDT